MTREELRALVARLATREGRGPEANPQADIRSLLLSGDLNLDDDDLTEVTLEAAAGGGKRIDIEAGFTVIEVKRDLRIGQVRQLAEGQLAAYVQQRTATLGQRYVGILTDGAEWYLYHLEPDGSLREVANLFLDPRDPDPERLVIWLENVMATQQAVSPTPTEIARRLGAQSPSHLLDLADLTSLYNSLKDLPEVAVKRELWSRLLTTAFGQNFRDSDELFLEHTYLVLVAEGIAHAVLSLPMETISAYDLVTGRQFATRQISGLVEPDFFDWVVATPEGEKFVRTLIRRISRFDWHDVQHDILKVLYESVIDADVRKQLGEYYTPDWLAERMVDATVTSPATSRVLDPACGSGTFLFHAVRRCISALVDEGLPPDEIIHRVSSLVMGIDLHPVAVILARVTYLLALGNELIQARGALGLAVPVYLGDSLLPAKSGSLFAQDQVTIQVDPKRDEELTFPLPLLDDVGTFDRFLTDLADKIELLARSGGDPDDPKALDGIFARYNVADNYRAPILKSFRIWANLRLSGRDHIWGYYVRNAVRPAWLSLPANRADCLIGNPPWLAFRFMPPSMRARFERMARARRLRAGGRLATNQDLSALFVARTTELYLKPGGRFGFLMPHAVLKMDQYARFRTANWSDDTEHCMAALDRPWDLSAIAPPLFPVPAAAVFGSRLSEESLTGSAIPNEALAWSGTLPGRDIDWPTASRFVSTQVAPLASITWEPSPYKDKFTEGSTFLPQVLVKVDIIESDPLGHGHGRNRIRSHRSRYERAPWRDLPTLEGVVEKQFLRPVHLGQTLVSFRLLDPWHVVVPYEGSQLLYPDDPMIDQFPGLADWWRRANQLYVETPENPPVLPSLTDRLDYQQTLTCQFPTRPHRVVYRKSSSRPIAAYLSDQEALVDNGLYWAPVADLAEADYLCAILNSDAIVSLVRPLLSVGQFGERNVNRHVFDLPIPLFSPDDHPEHTALSALGAAARTEVGRLDLDPSSQMNCDRIVRLHLRKLGFLTKIDKLVENVVQAAQPEATLRAVRLRRDTRLRAHGGESLF